jgi:small subunit ribosomal protein S17
MERKEVKKRELVGEVISNKMQGTVRVKVSQTLRHPVYHKVMSESKVYFAHTKNEHEIGDTVKIREAKPYSKNIRWVVVEE